MKPGYLLNLDSVIIFKTVFSACWVIFTRSGLSSEASNLLRSLSQMDMASLVSYLFNFLFLFFILF